MTYRAALFFLTLIKIKSMKSLVIMLIAFFAVFLQPPQVEARGFVPTEYIMQDLPPNLAATIFVLNIEAEKDYYSYSNRYMCNLLDEIYTTNSENYLNDFVPTTKNHYGYSMADWSTTRIKS